MNDLQRQLAGLAQGQAEEALRTTRYNEALLAGPRYVPVISTPIPVQGVNVMAKDESKIPPPLTLKPMNAYFDGTIEENFLYTGTTSRVQMASGHLQDNTRSEYSALIAGIVYEVRDIAIRHMVLAGTVKVMLQTPQTAEVLPDTLRLFTDDGFSKEMGEYYANAVAACVYDRLGDICAAGTTFTINVNVDDHTVSEVLTTFTLLDGTTLDDTFNY